jgi:hypothetical protein
MNSNKNLRNINILIFYSIIARAPENVNKKHKPPCLIIINLKRDSWYIIGW